MKPVKKWVRKLPWSPKKRVFKTSIFITRGSKRLCTLHNRFQRPWIETKFKVLFVSLFVWVGPRSYQSIWQPSVMGSLLLGSKNNFDDLLHHPDIIRQLNQGFIFWPKIAIVLLPWCGSTARCFPQAHLWLEGTKNLALALLALYLFLAYWQASMLASLVVAALSHKSRR